MIKKMIRALVAVLTVLPVTAAAGPRQGQQFVFQPPPIEAGGCYFYRGRRYCGRYCYTEINGKRYCQRRQGEAHPQGENFLEFLDPGFSLK